MGDFRHRPRRVPHRKRGHVRSHRLSSRCLRRWSSYFSPSCSPPTRSLETPTRKGLASSRETTPMRWYLCVSWGDTLLKRPPFKKISCSSILQRIVRRYFGIRRKNYGRQASRYVNLLDYMYLHSLKYFLEVYADGWREFIYFFPSFKAVDLSWNILFL